MNFLKTLLSSIFSSIYGYIAVAVGVVTLGLSLAVMHYKSSYETELKNSASLTAQRDQALEAAKICSRKTEEFKRESDARTKQAEEALKKAQEETKAYRSRADKILLIKPSNPDECIATGDLFQTYLKDLSK
jgi:hypothetical protein